MASENTGGRRAWMIRSLTRESDHPFKDQEHLSEA
jgi:hypothetical protein